MVLKGFLHFTNSKGWWLLINLHRVAIIQISGSAAEAVSFSSGFSSHQWTWKTLIWRSCCFHQLHILLGAVHYYWYHILKVLTWSGFELLAFTSYTLPTLNRRFTCLISKSDVDEIKQTNLLSNVTNSRPQIPRQESTNKRQVTVQAVDYRLPNFVSVHCSKYSFGDWLRWESIQECPITGRWSN